MLVRPTCWSAARRSASWPRAARRSACAPSTCTGSRRCRPVTPTAPPSGCSATGPPAQPRPTRRSSRRSAASSTGCRWRSSSRPRGRRHSHRARSCGCCAARTPCCAAATRRFPNASARSSACSTGATTGSTRPRAPCCGGSRCSPTGSTSRPPCSCARPTTSARREVADRCCGTSWTPRSSSRSAAAGATRYRLLTTVRAYAASRLEPQERAAALRRLAAHLLERARPVRPSRTAAGSAR